MDKTKRWLSDASFVIAAVVSGIVVLGGVVLCAYPGLMARQSPMDIKLIVEEAGYHDPVHTGSHPFMPGWSGCSESDAITYSVSAVTMPRTADETERTVSLAVCCGTGLTRFSKGCTVRVR